MELWGGGGVDDVYGKSVCVYVFFLNHFYFLLLLLANRPLQCLSTESFLLLLLSKVKQGQECTLDLRSVSTIR